MSNALREIHLSQSSQAQGQLTFHHLLKLPQKLISGYQKAQLLCLAGSVHYLL